MKNLKFYFQIINTVKNFPIVLQNQMHRLKGGFTELELRNGDKYQVRTNNSDINDIVLMYVLDSKFVNQLLSKLKPGQIVLDLGAHVGSFSIMAAKEFPELKFVAYEPSKDNFALLEENIKLNKRENIESQNSAIHTKTGTSYFVTEGTSDSWKLVDSNEGYSSYEEVKTTSLQDAAGKFIENKSLGFIKMDIEGAEFDVLENSKDLLKQIPYLLLEFHPDPEIETFEESKARLKKFFEDLGLHVIGDNHYTLVISNFDTEKVTQ